MKSPMMFIIMRLLVGILLKKQKDELCIDFTKIFLFSKGKKRGPPITPKIQDDNLLTFKEPLNLNPPGIYQFG